VSLAARSERIVELYFARKSEALVALIDTVTTRLFVTVHSTSSQAKLAARAAWSELDVVMRAFQASLFFVTTLFGLRLSALIVDGFL
jgi:hypothetical protein